MKNILQIMIEDNHEKRDDGKVGLLAVKEHLKERIGYYRKNNVPEVAELISEKFLTDSFFVVPYEDKERIFLVSYGTHEITLKDFTQAIIKVIELSGLCFPGVCKNFTDILSLIKSRMRIAEAETEEEALSVTESFLFNVIYQLEETSAISCSIKIDYLVGGFKVS